MSMRMTTTGISPPPQFSMPIFLDVKVVLKDETKTYLLYNTCLFSMVIDCTDLIICLGCCRRHVVYTE
jgi:hypothetical protein